MLIGDICYVGCGFYFDQKIRIDYISKFKCITNKGKRYTQVSGTLLKNGKRVNAILEFLKSDLEIQYKLVTKLELIKLIINGDKKAKKEYIIRYKKLPKINW